jgi:hypothetical protein
VVSDTDIDRYLKYKLNNMGNSNERPKMFGKYEHSSGKILILSIEENQRSQTQGAIDAARKDFTTLAHGVDYDDMVKKMIEYLTRHYDIGDGIAFRKTPLGLYVYI